MNILNVIKESVHNNQPFNVLTLSSANPSIILQILRIVLAFSFPKYIVSRVLSAAYCWDTRGIVLGLWRAKGGESGMIGGEGG